MATAEIYELVRAMRAAKLPRNRNFELHTTPIVRQARRVHRFLRSVERDLRRASKVRSFPRPDGGVHLELSNEAVRARRTLDLDALAHALLLEDADAVIASALTSAAR